MAAEVSTVDAVAIPTHYIGSHRYVYSDCPCGREAVVTSATGSRASVVRVRSWRVGYLTREKGLAHPESDLADACDKDEEIGRAHSELQSLMRISYAVFCL